MIDPSVIGRQNAFAQPDLLGNFTNALQARALVDQSATNALTQQHMRYQIEAQKRADAKEQGLNDLFKVPGVVGPDGKINAPALYAGAASQGFGAAIPDLQKKLTDVDKSRLELTKLGAETTQKQMEASVGKLIHLAGDPTDAALTEFRDQEKNDPSAAELYKHAMSVPLEQRQAYLEGIIKSTPNGLAFYNARETNRHNTIEETQGGQRITETGRHNVIDEGIARGQLGVAQGNLGIAGANLGISGQRLKLAQQEQAFQQAQATQPALTHDANGNPIYLPQKAPMGQPGGTAPIPTAIAPVGPDGKPLPGRQQPAQHITLDDGTLAAFDPATRAVTAVVGPDGKPVKTQAGQLNESQGKATAYLQQMRSATDALAGIKGYNPTSKMQQGEVSIAGSPIGNFLTSDTSQQIKQAQEQWSEAYLRFKTGAGTNANEIRSNIRTFFPQPGEGAGVVAQKAAARRSAEEAISFAAGKGASLVAPLGKSSEAGGQRVIDYSTLGKKPAGDVVDFGSLSK